MGQRQTDGWEELNANIRTKVGVKPIDYNPDFVGNIPDAVASYITVEEKGGGAYQQTVLTLTALPITMRDTEQGGGVKIYTFPEARIAHMGSTASLTMTTTSILANTLNTGVTCNLGVGTVTQSSATVTSTEQDLVNETAWTSSTTIDEASATVGGVGPGVLTSHDGTSTAIAAFLNLAVAGAGDIDANASITVSGTITITWTNVGDY